MKVILASASPRRKELLSEIFESFDVITADIDERAIENRIKSEMSGYSMLDTAIASVRQISSAKAAKVYECLGCPSDTLIIAADTAVAVSDEIMGKPVDRNDAIRMLRKLSLEKQFVLTGVTLIYDGHVETFAETSAVVFNKLDSEQERKIIEYCDTDEPYDKAGAYGIQVIGDDMVDHIEGDFNNIMGLPVARIRNVLKEFLAAK